MNTIMNDWRLPTEVKRPTLDDPEIVQLGILVGMDTLVALHEELLAARSEKLIAAQSLREASDTVELLRTYLIIPELSGEKVAAREDRIKRIEARDTELQAAIAEVKDRRIAHELAAERVAQREIAYDTARRRLRASEAILNYLAARP